MSTTSSDAATRILADVSAGDASGANQLLPLIYDQLRALAAAKLGRERAGHTL